MREQTNLGILLALLFGLCLTVTKKKEEVSQGNLVQFRHGKQDRHRDREDQQPVG